MSDETNFQANLQRGEMLRQQGRYPDAERYLQLAISAQPSNAEGYFELAFCYCNWSGHSKQALATIDHAISLDPNNADFFSLRAWILGNLNRDKEAVQAADQALAMNPFSLLALNAQTRSYADLRQWTQAEANARRTLEHFPRNELAANFLAIALRGQGRLAESEAVTARLLAQVPDNALAQCNAGWSALQMGDHRRANQHFVEALRLDPNYDYARRGLLHSFNSRVWIYRLYYQFISWLGNHRTSMRWFYVIVIYLAYRVILTTLRAEFGEEGVHWTLVLIALYLVIFGCGRSFGNLFLQLDPFARFALTQKEQGWSYLAGSLYAVFLLLAVNAHAWPQLAVLLVIPLFFLWGVLYPRVRDSWARPESPEAPSTEQG